MSTFLTTVISVIICHQTFSQMCELNPIGRWYGPSLSDHLYCNPNTTSNSLGGCSNFYGYANPNWYIYTEGLPYFYLYAKDNGHCSSFPTDKTLYVFQVEYVAGNNYNTLITSDSVEKDEWFASNPNDYHGILGFCAGNDPNDGYHRSLHRLRKGSGANIDHFYTTAKSEYSGLMASGDWNDEGIVCYVRNGTILPSLQQFGMIKMDGSHTYICDELTNNLHIWYDLKYDECLYECLREENNDCVMINYILNAKHVSDVSRCYIFDHQCNVTKMADSGDSDDNIVAVKGYNEECIDYPLDWSDIYDDECSYYSAYYWCLNKSIDDNLTISSFQNDAIYGLNAIQTCCECGGGIYRFYNIELEYSVSFNSVIGIKRNSLCATNWNLGDPNDLHYFNGKWDNLNAFSLCSNMKRNIVHNYHYILMEDESHSNHHDIDCNAFILNGNNNKLIVCDFDEYNVNDLYFISLFAVPQNNIFNNKSSKIYLNSQWFDINVAEQQKSTYKQCESLLSQQSSTHTLYGIFGCDIVTESPTSEPSIHPTFNVSGNGEDDNSMDHYHSDSMTTITVFLIVTLLILTIVALFGYRYRNQQKRKHQFDTRKIIKMETEIADLKSTMNKNQRNINKAVKPPSYLSSTDSDQCLVCCDAVANMFNYPCGHVSYCSNCSDDALKNDNKCPNCREIIKECKLIFSGGFKQNSVYQNTIKD